ncbi:MAG: hypothetical protein JKY00_15005 [Roseicyclus sp.]|nr:hypothetical protein [Roseicyclus sp.]
MAPHGAQSIGTIQTRLEISFNAISKHVSVLAEAP